MRYHFKKQREKETRRTESIALKCGQRSCCEIIVSTTKSNTIKILCRKVILRSFKTIIAFIALYKAISLIPNKHIHRYLRPSDASSHEVEARPRLAEREKCQIVYVLGVEGDLQQELTSVIDSFARQQVNPETKIPHRVVLRPKFLRKILTQEAGGDSTFKDESLIQQTINRLCPNDGKTHVIIEDLNVLYRWLDRIHRFRIPDKEKWSEMPKQGIADAYEAMKYYLNLEHFLEAYSPYATIKFIALHRPFLDSLASHDNWHWDIDLHANVLGGYMMMLDRFLGSHTNDLITGRKLWSLVCMERLSSKHYNGNDEELNFARQDFLQHISEFLSWEEVECRDCWKSWIDSNKNYFDPDSTRQDWIEVLENHRIEFAGRWPSAGVQNENNNLQCVT